MSKELNIWISNSKNFYTNSFKLIEKDEEEMIEFYGNLIISVVVTWEDNKQTTIMFPLKELGREQVRFIFYEYLLIFDGEKYVFRKSPLADGNEMIKEHIERKYGREIKTMSYTVGER